MTTIYRLIPGLLLIVGCYFEVSIQTESQDFPIDSLHRVGRNPGPSLRQGRQSFGTSTNAQSRSFIRRGATGTRIQKAFWISKHGDPKVTGSSNDALTQEQNPSLASEAVLNDPSSLPVGPSLTYRQRLISNLQASNARPATSTKTVGTPRQPRPRTRNPAVNRQGNSIKRPATQTRTTTPFKPRPTSNPKVTAEPRKVTSVQTTTQARRTTTEIPTKEALDPEDQGIDELLKENPNNYVYEYDNFDKAAIAGFFDEDII